MSNIMIYIPQKIKLVFTDTIWSVAGLVLMNAAAQFAVYPFWNHCLGSEVYGNIVYLMAIMNIIAISIGSGVNYARIRCSIERKTGGRPYMIMISTGVLVAVLVLFFLYLSGFLYLHKFEFVLYCILTAVTTWRYYADVEFRLHINYRGFFFYYLIIGIGYLFGILIFYLTELWPLTLLPGEFLGLLFVIWRGSIFQQGVIEESFYPVLKLSLLLIGTSLLSHLVFNGDRIILRLYLGGTTVSVFYIASLFGKAMTLITTPLNGVLAGHLAKYEGKLSYRLIKWVTWITLIAIILSTVFCIGVSYIVLPILYPMEFEVVKQYLMLASSAQIIYFMGNLLTGSLLLRFTSPFNQLIVNVIHGTLFVVICTPIAKFFGLSAFCWGLLFVNTFRLVLCLILGYKAIGKEVIV